MNDRSNIIKTDLMMFIAAMLWGFTFIAQKQGMEYLGPFSFNGIRYIIGSIALIPFYYLVIKPSEKERGTNSTLFKGGLWTGILMFAGAMGQQIGLQYTTAGNAGFVTGLYVILVPIIGLFIGKKTWLGTWAGAALGVAGLYLLSFAGAKVELMKGDMIVLSSSVFWAILFHATVRATQNCSPVLLSIIQYAICGVLCLVSGIALGEHITVVNISKAAMPILFAAIFSVGVAFTIMNIALKTAHPSHIAVLSSMEAPFALVGGWIMLGEKSNGSQLLGCGIMLAAMIVAQLRPRRQG